MPATLTRPAQSPATFRSDSDRISHPHNTSDRWRQAHDRAKASGIKVFELGRSRYAVTSSSTPGKAYEVRLVPESCTCPAAAFGDPVCIHRAAVRALLNPEPEPPHQPFDPDAEALQWAQNDLQRAFRDLERFTARIERGDVLTDREFLAFEFAQEREQDAHSRIVALKAQQKAVA